MGRIKLQQVWIALEQRAGQETRRQHRSRGALPEEQPPAQLAPGRQPHRRRAGQQLPDAPAPRGPQVYLQPQVCAAAHAQINRVAGPRSPLPQQRQPGRVGGASPEQDEVLLGGDRLIIHQELAQHISVFQRRPFAVQEQKLEQHILRRGARKVEPLVQAHHIGVAGAVALEIRARAIVEIIEDGKRLAIAEDVHAGAPDELAEPGQLRPAAVLRKSGVLTPQILPRPQQRRQVGAGRADRHSHRARKRRKGKGLRPRQRQEPADAAQQRIPAPAPRFSGDEHFQRHGEQGQIKEAQRQVARIGPHEPVFPGGKRQQQQPRQQEPAPAPHSPGRAVKGAPGAEPQERQKQRRQNPPQVPGPEQRLKAQRGIVSPYHGHGIGQKRRQVRQALPGQLPAQKKTPGATRPQSQRQAPASAEPQVAAQQRHQPRGQKEIGNLCQGAEHGQGAKRRRHPRQAAPGFHKAKQPPA